MARVQETFAGNEPGGHWKRHLVGTGSLLPTGSALRFLLAGASSESYSNAQIDDYQRLHRRAFIWHPPVRMIVRARFSASADQLRGTAGFGFWNDPFMMTEKRLPALPRAAWFFYASPASNMKLDMQTPGHGWKAATLDARSPAALAWAPLTPLAVPLMNIRPLYRTLWPSIQRALKVREVPVEIDMTHWHTYALEWDLARARFGLAGEEGSPVSLILDAPSPGGPLGFVMWLDNQYLVVTPWGRLGWGLLDVPEPQWMEVAKITIEPVKSSI
jgi:hypothetical protein